MADKPDEKDAATRAAELREFIAKRKGSRPDAPEDAGPDSGPRPGESPNAYVERRMRETLKKKE